MVKKAFIYIFICPMLFIQLSCKTSDIIDKNEKEWLKQHPNLVVGLSPNAPPYQFVNEQGEISGIFIDFLSIIENRLNYKFKKVYQSDFPKLLNDTKDGYVDVLLEVQKTEERQLFLDFTPCLLSHNHVIIIRSSVQAIHSIDDLKNKNIAVINKYAVQEYLTKNYPNYTLTPYFDDVTCLRAVSTGQADALICQQALATYYIENEGISNLKIAGEVDYTNELAIASNKNMKILNTILTKAVNSISNKEKQTIYNKWLSYEVKPFYLEAKFWMILLVLVLFSIGLMGSYYVILKKQVKQKTNELKKAKEKAEESDQLKTAFLQNISHEVRTPMNAIIGFSKLLLNTNLTNKKRKQFTDVMHKATYQLLAIVDNTMTLAHIETKQLQVNRIDFNPAKLISKLHQEYNDKKQLVEKAHIQLVMHEPKKSDLLINNDYTRINQILKILLDNAFKFTNKGSVEFGYTLDGNKINFFVKDTGIGIPPEKQEVIFKSFAQSDKTIRQLFGGLGVGLSIALGLVNLLEGKVTLNSQTNIGTEIIFSLPLIPVKNKYELPSALARGQQIKNRALAQTIKLKPILWKTGRTKKF